MGVSKVHQLKRRKKMFECILYIEINKQVPYKIIRKIDIKNVTRFL